MIEESRHSHRPFFSLIISLSLLLAFVGGAFAGDYEQLTGNWQLDEDNSGELGDQIDQLKQEFRDLQSEYGSINDGKPDPFEGRKFGSKEWESRRAGDVMAASVTVRDMVECEAIKLYVSDRIIVSYEGKIKRRLSPNPAGRVYSATGKGVSKDAIGQTLTYLDGDAFVIETRTTSAELLSERFELTTDDQLKLSVTLKNPDWKREVKFSRYFDRI